MKRYKALNLLKMLAIIGIIFHHYQLFTGYRFTGELLGVDLTPFSFFDGYFYYGYLVELFLGISGFFAAKSIIRIREGLSFCDYYKRKLVRFIPMLTVCGIVFLIALFIYHRIIPPDCYNTWCYFEQNMDLFDFLTSVLAVNYGGVFKVDRAVNAVTWNVSVVLICYAIFYCLIRLCDRLRIDVKYAFVAMVLLGIGIHEYGLNLPYLNDYSARGYMAFFSGVLLNLYLSNRRDYRIKLPVRIILAIMLFIGAVCAANNMELFAVVVWPLVISIFVDPKIEQHFKNERFWAFVGDMEFGTYLWHPIIGIAWCALSYILSFKGHSMVYMTVYTIGCMVMGVISFIFIEKPIKQRINTSG